MHARGRGPMFGWLMIVIVQLTVTSGSRADQASVPAGPDFKEVLSLSSTGSPQISPDGTAVLYSVRRADWDENRYDSELWIAREGEEPFQLTRTNEKSSSSGRWSPDGKHIAFLADRGDGTQIFLIRAAGGEARPLTKVEDGVGTFRWSPDGTTMAVAITDPQADDREKIEKKFGKFAVEDDEFRMTHLWVLDVEAAVGKESGASLPMTSEDEKKDDGDAESKAHESTENQPSSDEDTADTSDTPTEEPDAESPFRRLTESSDFTVGRFSWSPDGAQIAFDHQPDPRIESFSDADISVVDVATGKIRLLIESAGPDGNPWWSPDGTQIAFETSNGKSAYYLNSYLAMVPSEGGQSTLLTESFDENPRLIEWNPTGIYFIAWQRMDRHLYRLKADGNRGIEPVPDLPTYVWSADFSKAGDAIAIDGGEPDRLDEIYLASESGIKALTTMSQQTADWQVGTREIVEWTSQDGASIEGVLLKPEGFDPSETYPLLVIIHGGPAGISTPRHVYSYVYPVQQWLTKGALILQPNYRGSAGYGESFRSLNVRNLGVGDAWDVLSGVDYLVERGFVDTDRIGAMGWSQGGYISAFLTTTSDRFAAISVGAGISNWMTYYVNTDIHPFTRHYLKANPWDDPEIYAKTSPMTHIKNATTPTLIQHGEFDRRVPTPNAYELFQGLQDVGVDTELIIYKGFGHGIGKPKERLAAVWHNWRWFAKHIWGEEVALPTE